MSFTWSNAKYRSVFFQHNTLSKMCLGGGYMYFVAPEQAKYILPGNYALAELNELFKLQKQLLKGVLWNF